MEIEMNTDEPRSVAKPFQGTICEKSFVKESTLEEHISKKHVQDKEFQCTQCFETNQLVKSFALRSNLTLHIKRAHGPPRLKCHVCFKFFHDSSNFKCHKRIHSQTNIKKYKCALCPKEFFTNKNLKNHLYCVHKQRQENVKYFKCEMCSREFVYRSELEHHVVSQHVVDKAFECPVCSKTFIDQQTLDKHIKSHYRRNEFLCTVCSQRFLQKSSLIQHLGVTHNHFFYCSKCSMSFKNKQDFDAHNSDTKQELKCYICQELINSECNLKIHTDSHVKEMKTKTKDDEIKNQTDSLKQHISLQHKAKKYKCESSESLPFKCPVVNCGKLWANNHRLNCHLDSHRTVNTFKCEICPVFRAFKSLRSLQKHLREVHMVGSGNTITAARSLEIMKNTKPSDAFIFICSSNDCSFETQDEKDVALHYNEQHQLPKVLLRGNNLAATTGQKNNLEFDTRRVIRKRYRCVVCLILFETPAKLSQHQLTHAVEFQFKCSLCSKSFKCLPYLKKHVKLVHQ